MACTSVDKESTYHAGDLGSVPWSGRSFGEGNGNPLQYPCLENFMDRGAWWAAVHGVTKSRTRLSDFHFHFLFFFWLRDKEFACNAGDTGLIPGSGRSFGEGNGNPLQCSCMENPRDRGAWWAAVYGVAQSQTRLK